MDTQTLQRVQPILLELLQELDRVCRESGIRYFLYRGTLLGAVRHGGFIPWDDDLDVAMLRRDYERFRRIAPEKLGASYCFQDWHTEEGYAHPFGKLRKRNTLYVEAKGHRLAENGFYLDVYPLDYAPDRESERRELAGKLLQLYRLKLMKSRYTPWREGTRTVAYKRVGYIPYQALTLLTTQKKLIARYEALTAAVPQSNTVYEQSAMPRSFYFSTDWLGEGRTLSFEGTAFPVPSDYDRVLTALYGDYHRLPPPEHRENRHQIQELDFGE